MTRRARLCLTSVLALSLGACAFERTVVNERNRDLDPSGIVAGRSDVGDVVAQLGILLPDVPQEIGTRVLSANYLN